MLIIKEITRQIKEEVRDSEKYIKCALTQKDKDKVLAETYYNLSLQELKHMEMLHAQVTRIINEHRATKGEVPAAMQALYDYVHAEIMDEVKEVKIWQAMYRE